MAEAAGAVDVVDVAGVDPDVEAVVVARGKGCRTALGLRIPDFGFWAWPFCHPLAADAKAEDQPRLAPCGPQIGPVREKGTSPFPDL